MGALFWMWVTGIIGMATKYAEAILALKYRGVDKRGEMVGGSMYFIERGLGWSWLAGSFAFFGAIAAFGGGNMIQANSVSHAVESMFHISPWITGSLIALFTGLTILGGIKSIGRVASYLVPMMALFYVAGAMIIILYHIDRVPMVFYDIFTTAFSGQAAVGGFAGSTLAMALQMGVSRGLMTSEAGLGTASIAAAAAKSDHPGRQALVAMTGSFIATVFLCTVTALVIGVTKVLGTVVDGKLVTGAALTLQAFTSVISWGGVIVTIGIILFAFTTILGWAYYGEKCVEYLIGEKWIIPYRIIFTFMVIPGAVIELELVWKISDITNALMVYPNLIGICGLVGVVISETRSFKMLLKEERMASEAIS
jgi:alanine or glycine:cation symporter, AGCS family